MAGIDTQSYINKLVGKIRVMEALVLQATSYVQLVDTFSYCVADIDKKNYSRGLIFPYFTYSPSAIHVHVHVHVRWNYWIQDTN